MRAALSGDAMKVTDFVFEVKAVWQKNYEHIVRANAS
jgi:hypothetical protein